MSDLFVRIEKTVSTSQRLKSKPLKYLSVAFEKAQKSLKKTAAKR
jgi:hypothetical protein